MQAGDELRVHTLQQLFAAAAAAAVAVFADAFKYHFKNICLVLRVVLAAVCTPQLLVV